MNTVYTHDHDHDRLVDAAKVRARQLRAAAVDEFWNDAGAAAHRTVRAASRLTASLARHSRQRHQLEG